MHKHLVLFLESNKLLCEDQHGFRPGKSCLKQLLSHIETILNHDLEGLETDVVYLDFPEAFDKVDHDILIQKLSNFGIRGQALNWLATFASKVPQIRIGTTVLRTPKVLLC